VLEEPPVNGHLILVSSSPERILDTILSRVRKYELPSISKEISRKFLSNAFFSDGKAGTLEEYFYMQSGFDYAACRREADSFINKLLLEKGRYSISELSALASYLDEYGTYNLFSVLLLDSLCSLRDSGRLEEYRALKAEMLISQAYNEANIYNQSKRVFLDRLEREVRRV